MKKFSIIVLSLLILFTLGCRTKNTTNGNNPEQESITSKNSTMQLQPNKGDTIATLSTNFGEIKVLLYTDKTPETSKNFMELTGQGKYNNVPFHRIVNNFMIQGGDFESKNGFGGYTYKGPGTTLEDEFGEGLTHVRGAVSMANAGPDTGGSQFFIVQRKNGTPTLDGKHAVFGYAYEGMDVVDEIAALEADEYERPLKEVTIKKIEISEFE